ncbi:hypothetical protein Fmac_032710 [Flemingia macrophylla]|uniref:Uncharacterized protein n=1 Tax=Flemingia macrophylla TaxID=520843 RepID=A0ABD1L5P1_9FABA
MHGYVGVHLGRHKAEDERLACKGRCKLHRPSTPRIFNIARDTDRLNIERTTYRQAPPAWLSSHVKGAYTCWGRHLAASVSPSPICILHSLQMSPLLSNSSSCCAAIAAAAAVNNSDRKMRLSPSRRNCKLVSPILRFSENDRFSASPLALSNSRKTVKERTVSMALVGDAVGQKGEVASSSNILAYDLA